MYSPSTAQLIMRAKSIAVVTLLALPLAAGSAALAQSELQTQTPHASDDLSSLFSSSLATPEAGADTDETGAAPLALAAKGVAQSESSYGSHNRGLVSHLTFEAGGGFNAPIGNDQPYISWGGNLTLGAGYRFSQHISLLAEYQFMDNKLPGGLIALTGAQGGNAHIWSFTLDPVIDLFPKRKSDVYVTGGGGFYRKLTSFTDPQSFTYCDYYYCYPGYEDVVVGHFSSNQGGVNFGVGLTHKLGSDDRLKAFAEARYVWIDTPQIGAENGLGRTGLIPVTFGLRW